MENATLELEPRESTSTSAGQAPATAVATAAANAIDLRKLNITDVALAQFGDWEAEVKAATVKLTGVVLDMSNQSKLTEAKSLRQRTINVPIADARKTSVALKSKLNQTGKAVGARELEIVAAWGEVDKLITPQIDKREKELADEKAMRDAITAGIRGCHEAEADKLLLNVEKAAGLPSESIAKGIGKIEGLVFGPELGAYQHIYQTAQANTLTGLRKHLEAAKHTEAADALAAERKKLAEEAEALARERADLMRLRLAATVFTFPEAEPVAPPAPPAVEEPASTVVPDLQPGTKAPVSLVAQNNAARADIEPNSLPVEQPGVRQIYSGGGFAYRSPAVTSPAVTASPLCLPDDVELIDGVPCLKLGAIVARFDVPGLSVAFFRDTLGFRAHHMARGATYWALSDLPAMVDAFVAHLRKAPTA